MSKVTSQSEDRAAKLELRTLPPSPLTAFWQDPASLDLAPGSWRSGSLRTFMRRWALCELRTAGMLWGKGVWWRRSLI